MQNLPAVGIVSLGCAKNLVDSERLISALAARGYRIESDYAACDAVVINTCGFINQAVEESLEAIGQALEQNGKIIVMGCLGAKPETVKAAYPQVAAVFGPGRRAAVLRCIASLIGTPPQEAVQSLPASGVLLTPPHYAYLKIAEGCRHHCTFCIIPSLRGPLRSRLPQDILKEARALKAQRVRELLIIAQDSSDYGFDLNPRLTTSALLRELAALKLWLRVHYVYPSPEADRIVELMAAGLVLPYLDVPLQHAVPAVLKRMKRPGSAEQALKQIERWRSICPDVALRSTFITGFPGESEQDFEQLLDFIQEAKLDRVGCFPYSDVPGAAANDLDGALPPEVRNERAERLMALQAEISREKLRRRVGQRYDVLIDAVSEDGQAFGRTKYEAPDVDGIVVIEDAAGLRPGDLVSAVITDSDEHDLYARLEQREPASINFKLH